MNFSRLNRLAAGALAITLIAAACGDTAEQTETEAPAETTAVPAAVEISTEVPAATEAVPTAAELDAIMSQSASMIDSDPTLSLLLAMEANRRSPGSVTEQAILDSLAANTGVSVTVPLSIAPPNAQGCGFPFSSEDGLQIYQVVDGRLTRYDLSAGEVIDHGPAPDPCSEWVGDPAAGTGIELGRGQMVVSDGAGKWQLGTFGGELDRELAYEGRIAVGGRTMVGERIAFVEFGPSGLTMIVFDTTTGEVFAEIDEFVDPGSVTFGGDGSHLAFTTAVPGAGGQLIVLDAETAEEVLRVDLVAPGEESRFDLATGEVVIPTLGGRLLTVEIENGDNFDTHHSSAAGVVADVATAGTAEVVAVGIRPDGLVVIAREGMIEIVDRRTGPTGVMAPLGQNVAMRVQPDGSVMRINLALEVEIIDIDGNGLAGQTEEQWLARACEIAGRDFTQAEWDEFVPGDQTLQSACA